MNNMYDPITGFVSAAAREAVEICYRTPAVGGDGVEAEIRRNRRHGVHKSAKKRTPSTRRR